MNKTEYSYDEIKTHNTRKSVWIIIDDYLMLQIT